MKGNIIFLLIFSAVQAYFLWSIKNLFTIKKTYILYTLYGLLILYIITFFSFTLLHLWRDNKPILKPIKTIISVFFIGQIIAIVFFLCQNIIDVLVWLYYKISSVFTSSSISQSPTNTITRGTFFRWLGLGVSGGIVSAMLYGLNNKYKYQVKKIKLSFSSLPSHFKGFKIVQISDIHCGSFNDAKSVQKGIDMINNLNADIILFTGDLVNNKAEEMTQEYKNIFSQLKAPLGVYSILGNHDYGQYVEWESNEAMAKNLQDLKNTHKEMGWRLLLNENIILKRQEQAIALVGVENWSMLKRFPKYGKLSEALQDTENVPFKILLSHDPSHWEGEVIKKDPNIFLTLSGHTHGMQFGLDLPFFKWSPVQYVYKQWMGLYQHNNQYLYVNPGFGFIGYEGRAGILPEITLIELA